MQTQYTLSEAFSESLVNFFRFNDTLLLKESLRRQFIDYLDYELKSGLVPLYFNDYLYAFNSLLDILDEGGKEIQSFELEKHHQPLTTAKEKVVAFIKACINPEKIFLLHHDVKDNHEHFDLLVVIPSTSATSFSQYEQVIAMANMENASVDVSLHKSEVIQQQLNEGHFYYNMVCNKENLLYSNELPAFSCPSAATLQAMATNAEKQFLQAHTKAESFLEAASESYGKREPEMATFMLQQAVELNIRGLITALGGNCPKTHCFGELKKPLRRYAPELHWLLSINKAEENRLLRILERAYLEARYSADFSISDNDFTLLTDGAELLHEKTEAIFKNKTGVFKQPTIA